MRRLAVVTAASLLAAFLPAIAAPEASPITTAPQTTPLQITPPTPQQQTGTPQIGTPQIGTAAPAGWQVFTEDTLKFSVEFPNGSIRKQVTPPKDADDSVENIFAIARNDDVFIVLVSDYPNPSQPAPANLAELLSEAVKQVGEGRTTLSEKPLDVPVGVAEEFVVKDAKFTMRGRVYVTWPRIYVLMAGVGADQSADVLDSGDYQHFLDSFRISPAAP